MKIEKLKILFLLAMAALTVAACENEKEGDENGENETVISKHNEMESHNNGKNCMSCHKQGGPGEGWFTVAGSVYNETATDPFPNATVKLYTGPNGTGTNKKTIEVDGLGNFFTTENIDFGDGLYVAVEGSQQTRYMSIPLDAGQCNSCHGNSTAKISIK